MAGRLVIHKEEVDARFRIIFILRASLLSSVTLFTVVVVALTTGRVRNWTPSLDADLVLKALTIPVLLQVLLTGAMQEMGGLLGLVLRLLGGMPTWAMAVWGMTALVMNMTRPERSELDRLHG